MADMVKLEQTKQAAQLRMEDCFNSEETLSALRFISLNSTLYLTDYFLLLDDIKAQLGDGHRRRYSDYSFLVTPIHKAFESYLSEFIQIVLGLPISRKPSESIGAHLAVDNSNKTKTLELIEKTLGITLSKKQWIETWDALERRWTSDRNQLIHTEGIKVGSIGQAEQAAMAIINEINLSVRLAGKEFVEPVIKIVRERRKKKEAEETSRPVEPEP